MPTEIRLTRVVPRGGNAGASATSGKSQSPGTIVEILISDRAETFGLDRQSMRASALLDQTPSGEEWVQLQVLLPESSDPLPGVQSDAIQRAIQLLREVDQSLTARWGKR